MRKGKQRLLSLLVAALVTGAYLVFRPACVAIDAETVARFDPPIETRRVTTFYGTPVFQLKDGQWFQCKTWISRQFFF